MSKSIREIQQEHSEWVAKNFPDTREHHPLLGMVEEIGELSHAHLKAEQGIRGSAEKHIFDKKDALGDIVIYMLHYCEFQGFDLQSIIEETWEQVKKRDWTKNTHNGEVKDE